MPFYIGVPAVITLSAVTSEVCVDGVTVIDACRRLQKAGAAVVGLNCGRGPATMFPVLKGIVENCKVSVLHFLIILISVIIVLCIPGSKRIGPMMNKKA
jgi:hypothetical protein